jgi:hypothetical protein
VAIWLCDFIAARVITLCSFAFVSECAYVLIMYVCLCVNVGAYIRIFVINSVCIFVFNVIVSALYVYMCCVSVYACMHISLHVYVPE